jgi:hypothetical protein
MVIDDCFFSKRAHLCFLQIFPKESYTIPYMYPENDQNEFNDGM